MQFQDRPLPPQPSYTASWTGISSSSSTSLPAPAASSSAPPERKGTRTSARFTLSATHRPAPRPPIESHELPQSQPQPQRLPQATGSYGYSYNYSDTFNSLDSKSRARRTKAGSGSSSSMGAHSKTHSHSASTTTQPWYETAYERKIVVERKRAIRNKVRTAVSLHVELEENDYVPVDEVGRIYSDTIDNSNRANDVIAEELTAPRRRFGTPPAQYERLEEPLRDREAEIDLVEESLSLIPSARGQCARRFLSPLSLMCPQDCRTCGARVPAPIKPSPTPIPKRHGATTPSGPGLGPGTRPQGRSPSAELLDVTGLAGLGGLAAIRIDGESASGKGVGLPRPPSVVRS